MCFVYEGLVEEDIEKITFELDTKSGKDYVEAKGTFLDGLEDYDRLYINASGIYDDDLDYIGTEVEIDDTELNLELISGKLKIDNVKLWLALDQIKVGGDDISGFDETYVTSYGITIDNPEDSVEDNDFTIKVPEEELFAEITVVSKE